jgi:hypothetical protein
MTATLTTKNTFLAVLFLGLFTMTARNVTDPDVWWHLKAGEYIAQHKSVPHTDPFSYTRAANPGSRTSGSPNLQCTNSSASPASAA